MAFSVTTGSPIAAATVTVRWSNSTGKVRFSGSKVSASIRTVALAAPPKGGKRTHGRATSANVPLAPCFTGIPRSRTVTRNGTVNGVGLVVRGWSAVLRRLQTGSVRAYAMSLFFGVILVVGYYLYRFQGR